MIRTVDWLARDSHAEQLPESWLLIDQTAHAGLAGRLAESWSRLDELISLEPIRDGLLWASAHHDDGWVDWDAEPGLDSQGRPISFSEMRREDSRPLWTRSIQIAEHRSSIAGLLVAQHFMRLERPDQETLSEFAVRNGAKLDALAADVASQFAGHAAPLLVERELLFAAEFLRMFDWLSLVVCIGRLESPDVLTFPEGQRIELSPLGGGRFTATPWPFRDNSWVHELPIRRVPAESAASTQALLETAAPAETQISMHAL